MLILFSPLVTDEGQLLANTSSSSALPAKNVAAEVHDNVHHKKLIHY